MSLPLITREDCQKSDSNHKCEETDHEGEDDCELEFRCHDVILPSLGRGCLHFVSGSQPASAHLFTSRVVCGFEWPWHPADVEQERLTLAMVMCDIGHEMGVKINTCGQFGTQFTVFYVCMKQKVICDMISNLYDCNHGNMILTIWVVVLKHTMAQRTAKQFFL